MKAGAFKVFAKESKEMIRDKRVRSGALFGPFILVFMMMFSFGSLMDKIGNKSNIKLYVVKPTSNSILDELKDDKKSNIIEVPSMEEGRKLVASGKAPLVVRFPELMDENSEKGVQATIDVIYDQQQERSQVAMRALEQAIEEQNKVFAAGLLKLHRLPASYAAPIKIKKESVKQASKVSGILIAILPYFIIFWAFIGGMSAASDLVAGEKERNTLETLLITPVPRTQIVWGKFMSLSALCALSSFSGLAAVYAAAYSGMPGMSQLFPKGTGLGAVTLLQIVLLLIPTVAFFASILVAISTFAKNTREAQTYLGLASLVVTFPAILSQFIGFSDMASARWVNLIPVLNASAGVRSALLGSLDATSLLLTTGSSIVLAAIGITFAVHMFSREEVLLRV
jgi:sodium transport system permease protein